MRRGVVFGAVFMFLVGGACVPRLAAIAVAAGPVVTPTAVSATEGQPFSGQVGTLSPCTQSDTTDTVRSIGGTVAPRDRIGDASAGGGFAVRNHCRPRLR